MQAYKERIKLISIIPEFLVDVCKSEPCENGGLCFSDLSKDKFFCNCAEGFKGETCSEEGN